MTALLPDSTDLPALIEKAEALLVGVTPGPWTSDSEQSDGGSGRFNAYAVYSEGVPPSYGNAPSICDTHNAGMIELHEEADEDGVRRWDEVGRINMAFIAGSRQLISDLAALKVAEGTTAPQLGALVYCVLCIGDDGEHMHIFSTTAKRAAWADTDGRAHVFYDYAIDMPERYEEPTHGGH